MPVTIEKQGAWRVPSEIEKICLLYDILQRPDVCIVKLSKIGFDIIVEVDLRSPSISIKDGTSIQGAMTIPSRP